MRVRAGLQGSTWHSGLARDFGFGASPRRSSCGDHEVTYVTTGTKTVTLTVSNVLGMDTASATFEILP